MEILSENVDLDNSTISSKADEVTLVHMMKTHNVLMNTLRKTCIHATHLQEETKWLQEENSQLKVRLNLETPSHDRTPSMRSPQHDRNRDPVHSLYNLDTSDNYARRIYPEVSKSPGTVSGLVHYLYRNLSF
jgi:regulator of replication initiation timing